MKPSKPSKWLLSLLFGWFFALQGPYANHPTAKHYWIVGPFATEKECKTELDELKATLDELGATKTVFKNCTYKQES